MEDANKLQLKIVVEKIISLSNKRRELTSYAHAAKNKEAVVDALKKIESINEALEKLYDYKNQILISIYG